MRRFRVAPSGCPSPYGAPHGLIIYYEDDYLKKDCRGCGLTWHTRVGTTRDTMDQWRCQECGGVTSG